jgi:hypothetical protein
MPANRNIVDQMKDRQRAMFRVALDPLRYGLTLKRIEIESGLNYDSIRNYAAGETIMPITALDCLVGVIPGELLSLLMPQGWAIVQVPEQIDHDELAGLFCDYLQAKEAAHHPQSEAGRDIGPNENASLNSKVVQLPLGRVA